MGEYSNVDDRAREYDQRYLSFLKREVLSAKGILHSQIGTRVMIGLIAVAFIGAFSLAPVLATAVEDFLNIDRALVNVDNRDKEISALLTSESKIPKDGGKAFGYGILTDAGLDGVIVTTTHAGVKDSKLQKDR